MDPLNSDGQKWPLPTLGACSHVGSCPASAYQPPQTKTQVRAEVQAWGPRGLSHPVSLRGGWPAATVNAAPPKENTQTQTKACNAQGCIVHLRTGSGQYLLGTQTPETPAGCSPLLPRTKGARSLHRDLVRPHRARRQEDPTLGPPRAQGTDRTLDLKPPECKMAHLRSRAGPSDLCLADAYRGGDGFVLEGSILCFSADHPPREHLRSRRCVWRPGAPQP